MKEKIIDSNPIRQEFFNYIDSQKNKRSNLKKENPIQKQNIITEENIKIIEKRLFSDFEKKFDKKLKFHEERLLKITEDVFNDSLFLINLKKELILFMESEVRSQVCNHDFHQNIKNTTELYLKENLNNLIEIVVKKLVKNVNAKLTEDYKTTKELIYSIDSTIRHTVMKLPISEVTEDLIRNKLEYIFKESDKLRLDHKI